MGEDNNGMPLYKKQIKFYEYEIILFVFIALRFIYKNILELRIYFTKVPVFGLSETMSIVLGVSVLFVVCVLLALIFGTLIKSSSADSEKPVLFLVALFIACPASLPFLFDTGNFSGTQMLYPFALFILAVLLIGKPVFEWLLPIICATYFIPALFTSEVFFMELRKGAILYYPLILFFLFLDTAKNKIEPVKKHAKPIDRKTASSMVFVISGLAGTGSYIYTLVSGNSYYESFSNVEQRIDGYFFVCLLIVSPALVGAGVVLYKAVKNKFSGRILDIIISSLILLFFVCRNNYYGTWVPLVIISLFSVIFYSIWQKNQAMLSAVRKMGDYISEHMFAFYITLIIMASFSNVSSSYLSDIFQRLFENIPY
jgi:hypothetical protein